MSAFAKLHPTVSLLYFASVMSVAMFVTNPVIGLISLFGSVLFCLLLTVRGKKIKEALFYIAVMVLVTVTNPLFSHNGVTPLFFINGNPVTAEAILYGADIALMIVSVMVWCKCFTAVMTSDKLQYLLGRIVPQISLILSMALRFVPMLRRQANKLTRTQKAMGMYSSDSYAERIRSSVSSISVLIGWSLENAVETGKAMRARGYGLKKRTHYSDYRFVTQDAVILIICAVLWGTVLFGMSRGVLDFSYYPQISAIPSEGLSVICYLAYGCISLLPFVLETEEIIRWKYYRSKI